MKDSSAIYQRVLDIVDDVYRNGMSEGELLEQLNRVAEDSYAEGYDRGYNQAISDD